MPTDEQTKQDLARGFHNALTTKDWSHLREIMSPDVSWTLPGDNVVSGTASGVDEVIARAELIAGYGLTFTLDHILVSRDNMALGLHNTARRGEAVLDEHLATVRTLREGRIVAVETYLSDVDGMNAFFVPLD
jgi:ketosteroid isomerase-like protein